MVLNIEPRTQSKMPPVLMLGFRPFFIAAGIYAVVAIALWLMVFSLGKANFYPAWIPSSINWHAHEMLFGYTFAVITGFLLTAVRNWTGIQTLKGSTLAGLFLLWLAGRVFPYLDFIPLSLIAVVDSSFMAVVAIAIVIPLYKAKQYKQYGIVGKLFLLAAFNALFYLGVFGILPNGVHWGLYSALYVVMALVFVMIRRLIPFFIEKGIRAETPIPNNRFLDISSLVLFLLYWVFDVFINMPTLMLWLSSALFVIHAIRLVMWYRQAIWQKALLWVLWCAYLMITLAFALKAASIAFNISPYLAIHAFAVGGIGVLTIGMMARVALGHTGRDVFNPPNILHLVFAFIMVAAIVRVILPLFMPALYHDWVLTSQVLWIAAFSLFSFVYIPFLVKKRVDGRFG